MTGHYSSFYSHDYEKPFDDEEECCSEEISEETCEEKEKCISEKD